MKTLFFFLCFSSAVIFPGYAQQHTSFHVDRSVAGLNPSYTPPQPGQLLTMTQALKVFAFVKDSTGIEFNYSYAGCEKRAHAVSMLLKSKNIPHWKIWNIEPGTINFVMKRNKLHVTDHSGLNGKVEWPYHVAILLFVKEPQKTDTLVVDPALSNTLLNYRQWLDLQNVPDSYYTFLDPQWYSYYTLQQLKVYNVQMPGEMPAVYTGDYFTYTGFSQQNHWVESALAVNKTAVTMINQKVINSGQNDTAKATAYRRLISNFNDVTDALQGKIPVYFQPYAADILPYQQQYQEELRRWVNELAPLE